MEITKEEILAIVKANGLSDEFAEQLLSAVGKGLGGSIMDIIKLAAEKSENKIDDMIVAGAENTLRGMIDSLEVHL